MRRQVQQIASQGLVITQPKTQRSRRTILLTPLAVAVLRELEPGQGLVFQTRSGRPIAARNLLCHFKTVWARIGLPLLRFHDLRHTTASLLLSQNVHPKVVQDTHIHAINLST